MQYRTFTATQWLHKQKLLATSTLNRFPSALIATGRLWRFLGRIYLWLRKIETKLKKERGSRVRGKSTGEKYLTLECLFSLSMFWISWHWIIRYSNFDSILTIFGIKCALDQIHAISIPYKIEPVHDRGCAWSSESRAALLECDSFRRNRNHSPVWPDCLTFWRQFLHRSGRYVMKCKN